MTTKAFDHPQWSKQSRSWTFGDLPSALIAGEDLIRRFGALVRQPRLEKGMSQEHMAELCGLHRNQIGAIERAERTPSIVTADKLAKALDLTLSGLFLKLEW